MKKASVIIIGGGGRGSIYSGHLRTLSDRAEVVAIAEPRDFFRDRIAQTHHIPPENQFRDWHELLNRPKFADAVIITTQDRMHLEPAIAFARLKYDILIEKPLAPTLEECRDLIAAAENNGIIMSVCHVLRYTNFTRKLKELITGGKIGTVMSVQHLEPVGHWRFAHSYVRGNWRKEENSSSVLLAKSIHDLDWIRYIVDSAPKQVSSFGSLMFFKKENQPGPLSGMRIGAAVPLLRSPLLSGPHPLRQHRRVCGIGRRRSNRGKCSAPAPQRAVRTLCIRMRQRRRRSSGRQY